MLTNNDALGGAGSIGGSPSNPFKDALQAIAVGGLSRVIDGELSRRYPLTSFNEGNAIGAAGNVTPRAAPAEETSATAGIFAALRNPYVIGTGIALVAGLALIFALRR